MTGWETAFNHCYLWGLYKRNIFSQCCSWKWLTTAVWQYAWHTGSWLWAVQQNEYITANGNSMMWLNARVWDTEADKKVCTTMKLLGTESYWPSQESNPAWKHGMSTWCTTRITAYLAMSRTHCAPCTGRCWTISIQSEPVAPTRK